MRFVSRRLVSYAVFLSLSASQFAMAGQDHAISSGALRQAEPPRIYTTLPPSEEQARYNLPPTSRPRTDLGIVPKTKVVSSQADIACRDMDVLASYSGSNLANYIANLPNYECHYGLFALNTTQAAKVYSPENFRAVANRFIEEANAYNATNIKLVNMLIYLRAGYYLADYKVIQQPDPALITLMRPTLFQLINGNILWTSNDVGPSTASETLILITNMHDELYFLPSVKSLVERFTNSSGQPQAANALKNNSASQGFIGLLNVFFYAHYRSAAAAALSNDLTLPMALHNFAVQNEAALSSSYYAYLLRDASTEAYRFMKYPTLLSSIKPLAQWRLQTSPRYSELWLTAANAVDNYDKARCADYGTCNFKTELTNFVLKDTWNCGSTIRIRAQNMTHEQSQSSCALLAAEEELFHNLLQTNNRPVANDYNTQLEIVVFDNYSEYAKYGNTMYGISTNNGGTYIEGDPSAPNNQARLFVHKADWLPTFSIWNWEHEFIHYLDGRFNMYADYTVSTSKSTVWWIEGLAEYLSLKNKKQSAIDVGRTGAYRLSTIFGNSYSMSDYQARAYDWGYLATRFMFEKHRQDINSFLTYFRTGSYDAYQSMINSIGTKYDNEFAQWVQGATANEEFIHYPNLPECNLGANVLGRNCRMSELSSVLAAPNSSVATWASYAAFWVPSGAKNVHVFTTGGTGNADLYILRGRYPTEHSYDFISRNAGNNESVMISEPLPGDYYYVSAFSGAPFSGLTLGLTYDMP